MECGGQLGGFGGLLECDGVIEVDDLVVVAVEDGGGDFLGFYWNLPDFPWLDTGRLYPLFLGFVFTFQFVEEMDLPMNMKMLILALAGVVGVASASPSFAADHSEIPEAATAGSLATLVIDLSGIESWDWFNDPDNYTAMYGLDPNTHIVGVGWDLTIQTSGPSWMSEVTIDISNSNGSGGVSLNPGWSAAYNGTASFDSGGIISIFGNGDFLLNPDGILRMQVYESLDDNDDAVDATFLAGSSLMVQYVVIPTPGTLSVLGLGLLSIRRRR